jgi:hypothetical protein
MIKSKLRPETGIQKGFIVTGKTVSRKKYNTCNEKSLDHKSHDNTPSSEFQHAHYVREFSWK